MAHILTQQFQSTVRTSAGDTAIDLTARFGAEPVKAVWLWASRHPAGDDPNPTAGIGFSFGMAASGSGKAAGAYTARSGANQTDCASRARTDLVLTGLDPVTTTVEWDMDTITFGNGGITLHVSDPAASAYKFGGMAFGGDDFDAIVDHTGALVGDPTTPLENEIAMPWALSGLVLFQAIPADSDFDIESIRIGSGYFMLGMYDGTDQHVFDHHNRNAQLLGELDYGMIRNDRIGLGRNNVGLLSGSYVRLSSVQADKFVLLNGRSFTQGFAYMAMRLTNGAQLKVFTRTIPLTPSQVSSTVPGFLPGGIVNVQTAMDSLNANFVDSAFGFGVAGADGDLNEFGVSVASANSDPTNNENDAQSKAVYGGTIGPDAQAIAANLDSMNPTGLTETYTAVTGSAHITLSIAFVEVAQASETPGVASSGSEGEGTFEDTVWDITFSPRATAWIPCPAPVAGPQGLAGVEEVKETGNGYWKIILENVPLRNRAQVLEYREIEAKLTGRIGVALLTLCDGKFAPWPPDMSTIEAYAAEVFAVGDTSGSIQMANGAAPRPGMQFSTGQRTYRIETVGAVQSGDVYPITFWPKVREMIEDGAALEFVNLKLRCRLEDAAAMHVSLDVLRFGFPTLTFVEDVLP